MSKTKDELEEDLKQYIRQSNHHQKEAKRHLRKLTKAHQVIQNVEEGLADNLAMSKSMWINEEEVEEIHDDLKKEMNITNISIISEK